MVRVAKKMDFEPCFSRQSDGWDTEPFTLVEKDGALYGRGSTDDKVILPYIELSRTFSTGSSMISTSHTFENC